jgi:hypothetical protein
MLNIASNRQVRCQCEGDISTFTLILLLSLMFVIVDSVAPQTVQQQFTSYIIVYKGHFFHSDLSTQPY